MRKEYRIVDPPEWQLISQSATNLSPSHRDLAVGIHVCKILGAKGMAPRETLLCSITLIHNDKRPDGMIIVEGKCISMARAKLLDSKGKKFQAVFTPTLMNDGFGILTLDPVFLKVCTPDNESETHFFSEIRQVGKNTQRIRKVLKRKDSA